MMKIRKRNGSEVTFNKQNIVEAISRANEKVRLDERLTIQEIKDIAKNIEDDCTFNYDCRICDWLFV